MVGLICSPRPEMSRPRAADLAAALALAALGLLGPRLMPPPGLPPFLGYLLGPGSHWLLVASALVLGLRPGRGEGPARLARRLARVLESHRAVPWLALALLALVAFGRVPEHRRAAVHLGGDEPKYLRIAESLLRDADVDVSGGRTERPPLELRQRQLRTLALTARDAVADVFSPTPVPPGHRWSAGNWGVHGRHGGVYYLQPPGLPLLLAAFLGPAELVFPGRDPGSLVAAFLSCLWVLAGVETFLLTREVLGSRAAALLSTAALFSTAPVFVGGTCLYPESVALFLFPFCYRRLRASERAWGWGALAAAGLAAGGLWWIHPKFLAPSLVFLALAALRPRTPVRARLAFVVPFALLALSSLVYVHHVTGLFRPEGLYVRQAEEYTGVPEVLSMAIASGLANGLLGGRDGILVFAPVLLLAPAGLVCLRRAEVRTALELLALFSATWLTAAVHAGTSLGSPARLFVPVAFALALLVAWGVARAGPRPPVLLPLLFLLLVGLAITARTNSHWRLAANPYRELFPTEAVDFTTSLPAYDLSPRARLGDVARVLLVLAAASALGLRWRKGADSPAGLEALRLLAVVAALAFLLEALGTGRSQSRAPVRATSYLGSCIIDSQ